ncbi:TcfC E-set like domain-containing protein [Robbsia sp. Bb-Pol-6]|uniref:TcfC E-set like domain-containing protein n=1 Tax=Robbsia betulipollinis TaxID=2981849 RepID=A0ABT3ZLT5_9BURK|nr:TcfC E-set like domain-containing protein [Robbsia betulipollinis]MCY0387240.1 TcfC E-set like domain-containing protein [Robbsia betulipollinis]
MRSVSCIAVWGLLLLESVAPLRATAAQAPADRVPPGFENLAAIGESARIEVRVGGRRLGLFDARVTAKDIVFSNPAGILAALPLKKGIDEKDRTLLLRRLENPMARHSDLVCGLQGQDVAGCDYIDTKSIDIIYDESEEQADIFISKSWLASDGPAHPERFSVSPDTSRAFIQRNSVVIAGSSGYRSASLNAHAVLGATDSSFIASDYTFSYNGSEWGQQTSADVSNLYYRYDIGRRLYLQAGRMDARDLSTQFGGTFAFSMLPLPRMDGIRIGTTQAYVNPDSESKRTPVTILLSQNARVDAYRGAQLLSSSYFRSGIHQIDTQAFPPGTYLLTLRVVENGREVRTETQPFSRVDGGLGTPGAFQWFVQAGKSGSDGYSRATPGQVMSGGIKLSLSSDTSVTFGVAGQAGAIYSEGRLDWQRQFAAGTADISAAIFAGNDGSHGNAESLDWSGPYSALLAWTNTGSSDCSASRASSCESDVTASVSHALYGWDVRVGLTHASSEWLYGDLMPGSSAVVDPEDGRYRPQYFPATALRHAWVHRRSRSSTVQLSVSHVFEWRNLDIDTDASLYFRRVNRHDDRGAYLSLQLHHAAPSGSADGAMNFDGALTYSLESTPQGVQNQMGMSGTIRPQGALRASAGTSMSVDQRGDIDAAVTGRAEGRDGSIDVGLSDHYDARTGAALPAFSGTYSGTVALSPAGVLIGDDSGDANPMAAVIVSMKGDHAASSQTVARVRGDGVASQNMRIGESAFLPQSAYRPVDVDIEDPDARQGAGVASVKEGLGKRTWFMVPGHVGRQFATAQFTYTYVGRLTAGDKSDLANGIILAGDFVEINDDGTFAADFHHRLKALDVLLGNALFECMMPSTPSRQSLFNAHTVHCTPILSSALPRDVRNDAQVIKMLAKHHVPVSKNLAAASKETATRVSRDDG